MDLLQVCPGLPGQDPVSSSGPEGGWGWNGVPGSPLPPFPLRCMNILSAPMGATWPQPLLLRAHQLHTSGKGTMRPQAPAFPRPHPGVCPPLLLPLQEGAIRVEGWTFSCSCSLSGGRGASDRSDTVTSGAHRLRMRGRGSREDSLTRSFIQQAQSRAWVSRWQQLRSGEGVSCWALGTPSQIPLWLCPQQEPD